MFKTHIFGNQDECSRIRESFATKLHKNLCSMRLPLEMMAAFSLVPLIKSTGERDHEDDLVKYRTQIRECILLNYRRRKEYLRKNPTLQSRIFTSIYVCIFA